MKLETNTGRKWEKYKQVDTKNVIQTGNQREFLDIPVVRIQHFHCQVQVKSQVGELKSLELHSTPKKKTTCKDTFPAFHIADYGQTEFD